MDVAKLITYRKRQDMAFHVVGMACMLVGITTLVVLLVKLSYDGASRLSLAFFFENASYLPEEGGILMAWVGTLCVMLVTFLSAVPLGVAAAVYLEEYAGKNWLTALI